MHQKTDGYLWWFNPLVIFVATGINHLFLLRQTISETSFTEGPICPLFAAPEVVNGVPGHNTHQARQLRSVLATPNLSCCFSETSDGAKGIVQRAKYTAKHCW